MASLVEARQPRKRLHGGILGRWVRAPRSHAILGHVAQLAEAPVSGTGCWEFDSPRVYVGGDHAGRTLSSLSDTHLAEQPGRPHQAHQEVASQRQLITIVVWTMDVQVAVNHPLRHRGSIPRPRTYGTTDVRLGGATAAQRTLNPRVAGSNPARATTVHSSNESPGNGRCGFRSPAALEVDPWRGRPGHHRRPSAAGRTGTCGEPMCVTLGRASALRSEG